MIDYITKPVKPNKLKYIIEKYLWFIQSHKRLKKFKFKLNENNYGKLVIIIALNYRHKFLHITILMIIVETIIYF
jgi:response regulator RpfG family c-di-GMP phosphodiesterase